jgi:hypothetical protein
MSNADDIQAAVDRSRADLAATLNELEDKLNIPKQLGVKARQAQLSYSRDPKPWLVGAAIVAVALGGVALIVLRRR